MRGQDSQGGGGESDAAIVMGLLVLEQEKYVALGGDLGMVFGT